MAKWKVNLEAVVTAADRAGAFKIANKLCYEKLDDLVVVHSVDSEPLKSPEHWVSVNDGECYIFDGKEKRIPPLVKG